MPGVFSQCSDTLAAVYAEAECEQRGTMAALSSALPADVARHVLAFLDSPQKVAESRILDSIDDTTWPDFRYSISPWRPGTALSVKRFVAAVQGVIQNPGKRGPLMHGYHKS